MRIGMLTDAYKPVLNGVTNFIMLHKRALEALGHTVYVFTWGNTEAGDEADHVIRSPALPLSDTGYHINFLYSRAALRRLQTMDVLHVHHPFVSGQLALRYGKAWSLPVVYTNHTRYDLYAQHYLPPLSDTLAEVFLQSYMPGFTAQCDLVVAPSAGLATVLRGLGVTVPITIIPNGTDLKAFRTPTVRHSPAEFGWSEDACVLIYTGRLGPEKNLDLLLRAFAGAATAIPELRLLLVGDGPEAARLREQAAQAGLGGRVHFAGRRPYEEIPAYLAAATAFVTASVTEVQPLSVLEALAAGLPVLGVDAPGVNEAVEDGTSGLLAPEDAAALAAQIVRLVLDRDLRARLAAGAMAAGKRYAIEDTTAQYVRCYEELIGRRSSPPSLSLIEEERQGRGP